MEYNFDKEIDLLLRQTARGGGILSENSPNAHLDADEISMFAENAMPERARQKAVKHFAECDDCRMILSNVILLNSEAETEAASSAAPKEAVAPVVTDIPWYKRLFDFPQLAVGMGALALVFSGVVGFLIYQAAVQERGLDVAQTKAPSSANQSVINANAGAIAPDLNAEVSNTMSANANAAVSDSTALANTSDAQTSNTTAATEPPATTQQSADSARNQPAGEMPEAETETRAASSSELKTRDESPKEEDRDDKNAAGAPAVTAAPPPAPAATPPPAKKRKDDAESESSKTLSRASTQRQVGGKTFNRVNGVWIDTEYRTMGNTQTSMVTNVRRGSSAYKKLDRSIRIIAESLEGEVIVVSGSKAYRIY